MTPNEYQKRAMKFAKYATSDYPFLALCEETGEVLGKLAKYCRKNEASLSGAIKEAEYGIGSKGYELRVDLVKELGDVMWQLQACCSELGVDLEYIMDIKLMKLKDRDIRNVIVSEGDER